MTGQRFQSIRKAYRPKLVILVVEDHMMFTKDMKHALPMHTLVFARTIEEGKARYEESLPDLIFLDIDLPDGNGFDLLDAIRAREPNAYVIMLTGSKLKEDIAKSQQKGAHGYMLKPFTRLRVEEYIEDYLALREKSIKSLLAETEQHRQQTAISPPPDMAQRNAQPDD